MFLNRQWIQKYKLIDKGKLNYRVKIDINNWERNKM